MTPAPRRKVREGRRDGEVKFSTARLRGRSYNKLRLTRIGKHYILYLNWRSLAVE